MGAAGAVLSAALLCGAPAQMAAQADCQGDPVSAAWGSVAADGALCFPPVSTVRRWFYLWRDNRLWLSLNQTLSLIGRAAAHREASSSAGVTNRQCVKTAESGEPLSNDAGEKINGLERHILTDTDGNLVHAVIHTSDIQDRDDNRFECLQGTAVD